MKLEPLRSEPLRALSVPLDQISQRPSVTLPLDHYLIARLKTNSISVARNAAAKVMDVRIAGNAVGLVLEKIPLHLGQRERRVRLTG